MKRRRTWIASLILLGSIAAPGAQAQAPADRWTFTLTPYVWLPSADGSLRYGPPATGGAPNVAIDGDVLGALDLALMLAGEARKGRWSIAADYIYLDLSSDSSSIRSVDFNRGSSRINVFNTSASVNTDTELKGSLGTLIGGYSIVYQPRHTMDIIGGVRYLHLKASTNWLLSAAVAGPAGTQQTFAASGGVEKSEDLWDAIIGVRGRVKLGAGNWFVPYHLDAGGGSSRLTWQGVLGVGYSFKRADVLFNYRYLSYEQGGDKLIDELSFAGFSAGVAFRF